MNFPESSTLLNFKENITDAVVSHARRLFGPMIGIYLLQFVLTIALVVPLFLFLLPAEFIDIIKEAVVSGVNPDPEELELLFSNPDTIRAWLPKLIAGLFFITLPAIFINAVVYNIAFKVSQGIIEQGESNTGNAFRNAFDKGLFRLIGLSLVLLFLSFFLILFSAVLASLSPFLLLFLFIPIALILLRLSLSFACVTTGEMQVMEALKYSWNTITWKRSVKLLLAGIVLFVVLIVFALFTELLKKLFPAGLTQSLFTLLIQVALGIGITAVIVAALNGLFYRYGHFEVEGPEKADEHLVN